MSMAPSTDQLVEAFSAKLVERGRPVIYLDEDEARAALMRVHRLLEEEVQRTNDDAAWRRALVGTRNIFEPSAIGSFDDFESVMRAKQVYLTDHPNPFYQFIAIKIPPTTARALLKQLPKRAEELVGRLVDGFLTAA